MFSTRAQGGYRAVLPGIEQKTLVYGELTLMAEFQLTKGSLLPRHSHPHEQSGYLISGHLRLSVGSDEFDANAGDSWCIAAHAEHSAAVLENSVAIEVFSPVREDYLPR